MKSIKRLPNRKFVRQRRKLSKLSIFITPLLVLLIIGFSGYLLFVKYRLFDINNIEVSGTKSFVNEIDLKELARMRAYDKNIFTFNSNEFKKSLLHDFQGAKDIFVSKKLPRTISINIVERIPLAITHDFQKANFFLIDEDGYVLGQIEPNTSNFPEISYEGEIEVGFFLDKEAVSIYIQLLKSIDSEKLSASSMSVRSDYVTMYIGNAIEVLVGKDKDVPKTISTLSILLKQLATEGKDVKRVDLRYDKVIVSYR
jgi:cell division septal protein FtsQ